MGFAEAADLLLRRLVSFLVLFLPAVAISALAAYKGIREVVSLGMICLAATGAAGYLVFWLWFAWCGLSRSWS